MPLYLNKIELKQHRQKNKILLPGREYPEKNEEKNC